MAEIRCFVSVIAPVRDAKAYVAGFIDECVGVLRDHFRDYELVLIDDASADGTAAIIDHLLTTYPGLRVVRLARRFGPDVAITAGLDTAIGDYLVVMNPATDPPGEIPAMVAAARAGVGVVTGVDPHRRGEPVVRRALRWAFTVGCERLLGIHYPRYATRFQVLSRAAANAVARVREKRPVFPVLASQIGFGGATHTYRRTARPGPALAPSPDAVDRALAVVVHNSISPLRLVSYLGITAGAINLVYALYVMGQYLFNPAVAAGWTTLSLQMSGMFFLMFLILTVVCEYVGHTLREATDKPLYHVMEERNSSVILQLRDRQNVLEKSA